MAETAVNKSKGDTENKISKSDYNTMTTSKTPEERNGRIDVNSNFKDPVLQQVEVMAMKNTHNLQDSLMSAVENHRMHRKSISKHNPGPLSSRSSELGTVIGHLEELILYESEDENKQLIPIQELDNVGQAAVVSHSLAAFVSTLDPNHLRKMSTRIVSDTGLWISRLFRFFESSAYFHDDPREGLVRICRMALHVRYPKFASEGYETLYTRPPVIYISTAAKSGLGQYLCSQLGLPLSSLCTVPCNTLFGSNFKMDIAALENLIQDDIAAQKLPLLIIANAGTPIVGHVDNLQRLQEICKTHDIWLHVEGHSLAGLCLVSLPNLMDPDAWPSDTVNALMITQPAKIGDSMTLPLGIWLGIPSVPYVTLFKAGEATVVHAAGLTYSLHLKLNCLPLWISLQNLGSDGVVNRIRHAFELSKYMLDKLSQMQKIRLLGKFTKESTESKTLTVSDVIAKPVSTSLLFEILVPTVVFLYADEDNSGGETTNENNEFNLPKRSPPYFDNLNSWLGQILQRDVPRVHLDIVDLDNFGVCIRFSPLENASVIGTTKEDLDDFINVLHHQISILNATVKYKETFRALAASEPNLQIVEITNWAGLGGLRYIPDPWLICINDLTETGLDEINKVNRELVLQLKNTDSAFSLGEGEDGLACVRFGMVTEDTDMEELISLVITTGKEVEESSKYLETMADIVRKGIETAQEDLKKENEEKIWQEGLLRQVPLVGTFVNWWSPLPKETGIKGRSFNLHSGVIESTENIYRYHMQIQEGSPKLVPSTPRPSVQTPVKVSPQHSRTSSKSSTSSKQGILSNIAEKVPQQSEEEPSIQLSQ